MINRTPPELFSQAPIRSEFTTYRRKSLRLRRFILPALLIIVLGGIGGFWMVSQEGGPTIIPTIKAEGPTKQKPDDPGGIEIPHQDEMVFQKIDNSGANKANVEHLLPPPEVPQAMETTNGPSISAVPSTENAASTLVNAQPAAPSAAPVQLVTTTQAAQEPLLAQSPPEAPKPEVLTPPVVTQPEPSTATTATKELPQAVVKTQETPAPKAVPTETKAAEAPAKAPEKAKPAAKETASTAIAKPFTVQLGSFPEETTAQSELKKIQVKYSAALSGVKLHVKMAEIGGKGTFYRVQGGKMTDAQARSVCAQLWSKKAPCLVVRP